MLKKIVLSWDISLVMHTCSAAKTPLDIYLHVLKRDHYELLVYWIAYTGYTSHSKCLTN